MYLTILMLPLMGSIMAGLFGSKMGVTGSHLFTTFCLLLSSVLASMAFFEVILSDSPVSVLLISWIDSELLSVKWEFLFDSLSVTMLMPVLYMSSMVHMFSMDYMSNDPQG